MSNTTDTRDQLALERTHLANERTLLAYIRTGLSLLAATVLLLHFAPSTGSYVLLAWCLAILGCIVLAIGILRFFKVKKRLHIRQ